MDQEINGGRLFLLASVVLGLIGGAYLTLTADYVTHQLLGAVASLSGWVALIGLLVLGKLSEVIAVGRRQIELLEGLERATREQAKAPASTHSPPIASAFPEVSAEDKAALARRLAKKRAESLADRNAEARAQRTAEAEAAAATRSDRLSKLLPPGE